MNKRIIVLIALVACVVCAAPASADEAVEVRGTVVELTGAQTCDIVWDASNFAAFWYDLDDDLMTETLTIAATYDGGIPTLDGSACDRTIDEGSLTYTTMPVYQGYELYACEGLTVDGDDGYYFEGWMGWPYVAIGGRADKLCVLLVEFWDDDVKTLETGEEWDLGGGFALELTGIDYAGVKATVQLSKNGSLLDTGYLDTSGSEQDRVYTYTEEISGESDVPVFSCYVNVIDSDTDTIEIMYVFLIDNEVLEIECGEEYDVMEVVTASATNIILENDETTVDLDRDTMELIMGSMYFKTADDDTAIRFYPMVEYTEPGTYEVRGNVADAACAASGITWDARNFAAFWYDLDDDLQTESLVLASGAISDSDRTINEDDLIYTTMPVYQHYELWSREGLVVDGDTYNLERGYYIEGWLGETYISVNGNADKLVKLLVEFEDDDNKTLSVGEEWGLGGGFTLTAKQIDLEGDKVWLKLDKDGEELDSEIITSGEEDRNNSVYTYTADLAYEDDVPVFSCLVDVIDRDTNTIEIMYVFLIDNEVLEIETSQTYGAMEATTASSSRVVLRNYATTIDLYPDTIEHIMGDIYFKTADDDILRFYPFISGEETEEEEDIIPATDSDDDGVPDAWDDESDTPAGYWTDSDGCGRMWGDMNGDHNITSADALMILQAAVGSINL